MARCPPSGGQRGREKTEFFLKISLWGEKKQATERVSSGKGGEVVPSDVDQMLDTVSSKKGTL